MPLSHDDRWVRRLAVLVPREIREHFLADLLAERADMRVRGTARWRMTLSTLKELLEGAVQHIPLRPRLSDTAHEQPVVAEKAAQIGWIVWRLSGLCLFAGLLAGSTALFVGGIFLLAGAFASVAAVAATGRAPLADPQSRLVTGVLVGTVTTVGVTLACAVPAIGLLGIGAVFGSVVIGKLAMGTLVFMATATACAVSLSGWVPQEWYPKRLVRTREASEDEYVDAEQIDAEQTTEFTGDPVGFREHAEASHPLETVRAR